MLILSTTYQTAAGLNSEPQILQTPTKLEEQQQQEREDTDGSCWTDRRIKSLCC